MHRCPPTVVVLVLAMGLAPAHADPDPELAKRLAEEAAALATRGEFDTAADRFREAFMADPRPEYGCNVGVAYYKAVNLPRAHRYLQDCERIGTSLERAYLDNVRAVIGEVEVKLMAGEFFPVDFVLEPATATIEIDGGGPHDQPLVGSRRAWFPFGAYRVMVRAAGYVEQAVVIEGRTRAPVTIRGKLERPLAPATDPALAPELDPTLAPPVPIIPVPAPTPGAPPPSSPSFAPAWIGSAITAVSAVTAGALYWKARSQASSANDQVDFGAFTSRRQSAASYQHAAWIVGGITGLSGVVSGYLWYRASRGATRIELTAQTDGGVVTLSGAW